ncbi:flavin reductase family protein [Nakamurella endophytica]|uniref:Flavin reductase n=1 Tax=Nakamurella endophytica TaxID=1748367 RepID=A0A917ST13_9ACTN|nr:flavin reductase family protein [Nakamurella endophytica]GGL94718.1 flavin reductase [Nakamurella endophytica]
MFYDPRTSVSGLPHSPFNSCCVPRPIGWISTRSRAGVNNLAPFSQFMNVTFDPPTVLFSSCGTPQTDTANNAIETGEFVWNMATYDQRDDVVRSAAVFPPDVDEFDALGIPTLPSTYVAPPRIAASPVHFECVVTTVLDFPGRVPKARGQLVLGEVIGIHIRDDAITADGRLDVPRLRPLARLGYLDYTSVESRFELTVPGYDTLFHNPETLHGTVPDGGGRPTLAGSPG